MENCDSCSKPSKECVCSADQEEKSSSPSPSEEVIQTEKPTQENIDIDIIRKANKICPGNAQNG